MADDERLRSWLDSPDERWWCAGNFGAVAASNSTSACRLCGAVVYDIHAHEAYHRAAVVEGEGVPEQVRILREAEKVQDE